MEQQILDGGTSSRLRKWDLRDPKYTLKDMLVAGDVTKSLHISRRKLNPPDIQLTKKMFALNKSENTQKLLKS